jgi:hypothetical protein
MRSHDIVEDHALYADSGALTVHPLVVENRAYDHIAARVTATPAGPPTARTARDCPAAGLLVDHRAQGRDLHTCRAVRGVGGERRFDHVPDSEDVADVALFDQSHDVALAE